MKIEDEDVGDWTRWNLYKKYKLRWIDYTFTV
jgi:hypothetical protein